MEIDQSLDLKRENRFDRILLHVATLLFIFTVVLATLQVLVRTANLPISGGAWWTEPLSRYTLIVGTFFGAAVASRNNEHISLELALDKLAEYYPTMINVLKALARVITVAFILVATVAAVRSTVTNIGVDMTELRMVPRSGIYALIAVAFGSMLVYESDNLREEIRVLLRGSPSEEVKGSNAEDVESQTGIDPLADGDGDQ